MTASVMSHKRYAIWAVIVAASVMTTNAALTEKEAKTLAIRIGKADHTQQILIASPLTPEDREVLCTTIRAMASANYWVGTNERSIKEWLIICGDEPTIAEGVAAYLSSPVRQDPLSVFYSGNPRVLEMVAPELFREEKYEVRGGDAPFGPLSYDAAGKILELLGRSPYFNGEVISWAQRNRDRYDIVQREMMRDWWKENEKFFKAKDYKAAVPGWEIPPFDHRDELRKLLKDRGLSGEAKSEPAPPPTQIVESPAASPSPPHPLPAAQSPTHQFDPPTLAVAGGLVLILIVSFLLYRRKG